jgi:hypothetical protein
VDWNRVETSVVAAMSVIPAVTSHTIFLRFFTIFSGFFKPFLAYRLNPMTADNPYLGRSTEEYGI